MADEFDTFYRGTAPRLLRYAYGLTTDAAVAKLLGSKAKNPRQLAVLFYAWKIGTTPAQLLMYRTPDGKVQEFLVNRR